MKRQSYEFTKLMVAASRTVVDAWWQWLSVLYVVAISFGLSVALARVLGVEGFGTYSYLLSFAGIVMILQDGGYKTALFRDAVDRKRVEENLSTGTGFLLSVTLLAGGLVVLLQPHHWLVLLIAIFCMGLVVLIEWVSSVLKGGGDFREDAFWKGGVRTLTAGAVLLLLFWSGEVVMIFLAWAIALLFALLWPLKQGLLKWPRFNFQWHHLKSNLTFLLINVATVLYYRSDMVLLEYLQEGSESVGQYAVAYRVLEGVVLLATPVAQIAFRALRMRSVQPDRFFELFRRLLLMMMLASGVVIFFGDWLGADIIGFVFGSAYGEAGELLFWLLLALLFVLPNYMLTQGAIALNVESTYAWIAIGVALLNIGLNFLWIPLYGATGAAWATIVAEGVLTLGLGTMLWVKAREVGFAYRG